MPVTLMWGERGLVATLFMDLSAVPDCARWIAFLQKIQFVPPGPALDWNHVQHVWAVVEPGFGNRGFGSPDAVFRLKFADNRQVVVLLEAKLGRYKEVCWPQARGRKGFNSRLNGQVELNHCLTLALAQYQPESHQLIDPDWVLQTPYAAARPGGRRRRVNDAIVRQQLVTPLINAQYLHVIVTADQQNPLADQTMAPWLPQIFVAAGQENAWAGNCQRFGWTSWATLWKWAQGWEPTVHFCANLEFNLPNLFPPGTAGGGDELPAGVAQGLPPGWPPTKPARGVSLIFAPAINQQTFLHFSWQSNSCRLRNYIPDSPPAPDETRTTMEVLALTMHEERHGARRPPTGEVGQWRAIIRDVNRRYGLGN